MSKIAVVIVNYKTPALVTACLASLKQEAEDLDLAVFIGDAASGDGSVEIISDYIKRENLTWAQCFDIGTNGGFAYGNNAVVERCVLPDPAVSLVHFLNPDTYIRSGAVSALVRFLQTHPAVGVAGSRLENPDGSLRSYGFRFPAPWREFFRGARLGLLDRLCPTAAIRIDPLRDSRTVDWVSGASFMVRREILDDIGLMDDGFFLYFEETDWMRRARSAGCEVWHVSDSHVVHIAGQATGLSVADRASETQPVSPHWLASRQRYMRKHFGPVGLIVANVLFLAGDMVYRLHRCLRGRPIENPPRLWQAYLSAGKKEH